MYVFSCVCVCVLFLLHFMRTLDDDDDDNNNNNNVVWYKQVVQALMTQALLQMVIFHY